MSETECDVPGCGKAPRAKGKCPTHYQRARRLERGEGKADMADPLERRGLALLPPLHVKESALKALEAEAAKRGGSVYRAAVDVIERWAARRR